MEILKIIRNICIVTLIVSVAWVVFFPSDSDCYLTLNSKDNTFAMHVNVFKLPGTYEETNRYYKLYPIGRWQNLVSVPISKLDIYDIGLFGTLKFVNEQYVKEQQKQNTKTPEGPICLNPNGVYKFVYCNN